MSVSPLQSQIAPGSRTVASWVAAWALCLGLAACSSSPPAIVTSAPAEPAMTMPPSPNTAASAEATGSPGASGSALPAAIAGIIDVGPGPCALEVSPEGRVFATLYNTGDVVVIDPATDGVTELANLGDRLCGVAWAGSSLWVASLTVNELEQIDPASGRVLMSVATVGAPWDAQPDATGVWVADRGLPGVVHVDAATGRIDRSVETGSLPTGLAVVAGQLWVSVQGANEVDRLDANGSTIDLRITEGVAGQPTWFADDGQTLWLTSNSGDLMRIDGETGQLSATLPLAGSPRDPVYAFGAVWVANGTDGMLYRVDPVTDQVTGTVSLGTGIWTVEQVGEEVWVEQYNGRQIYRVDPSQVR